MVEYEILIFDPINTILHRNHDKFQLFSSYLRSRAQKFLHKRCIFPVNC